MGNVAREESMEDVLASIRRLVSEETERMPDMREAASASHAQGAAPQGDIEDEHVEAAPEPTLPSDDELFADTYRRIGAGPFKDALYEPH